jgi:hypothetical protein
MSGAVLLRCRSLPGSIQALMEPAQALTTNTFALALELAHKSIAAAANGQSGGAALPKLAQQLCARRRPCTAIRAGLGSQTLSLAAPSVSRLAIAHLLHLGGAGVGGRGRDGLDPQWAAVIHNGLRKL